MTRQNERKMPENRKNEALFLLAVTLFWFAQYVYIPYQTIYLTDAGTAGGLVGIIVGVYGVSQMVLRFPVGLCADRVGRHKPFILAGTLASGLASLIRVAFCNAAGFLAANLLSGLASAMWISFMVYYTGSRKGEEGQQAMGRIVMFNNLGMLSGFVVSTLAYGMLGMRKICMLSVSAGGLAFLLAALLKETVPERERLSVARLAGVCKNKRLVLFSLVALIQQGIQLATTMSFTSQILRDLGASDRTVGISSIIYMLSAVAFSAVASSGLCGGRGPRIWIPGMLLALGAYCVLVPLSGSWLVILALQLLPGMAAGILFSFATSEAMAEVPPEKKSTAMGFYQAVYAVGMTCFPMLTGAVAALAGMQAGFWCLAGIALAGCVGMLIYYKRGFADSGV